jgi:hypothetical protein
MRDSRQAARIIRPLNIKFCLSHENPPQWNLSSVIGDISIAGVKFIAPKDLKEQVINLEVRSSRIAPRTLKLEAMVVDSRPSQHPSFFDIRAKFINLSEESKRDLSILEKPQP